MYKCYIICSKLQGCKLMCKLGTHRQWYFNIVNIYWPVPDKDTHDVRQHLLCTYNRLLHTIGQLVYSAWTYSSVYSTWVLTHQSTVHGYLLYRYDRPPHTRSVGRSHNSCWSHCGQQLYPVTRNNTVYSQYLYKCSIWQCLYYCNLGLLANRNT